MSDFDWDEIKAQIETEEWGEDELNPGMLSRRVYLGTVMDLFPSGKFYTAWANSNVTEEEANRDEEWFDGVCDEASERGLAITFGESDPCDVFAAEYKDEEGGE